MSLYDHRQWATMDLASEFGDSPPVVFLLFGDEFLVKQATDRLIDALVRPEDRTLALERFDGPDADIDMLLERINTYSFMGGCRLFLLSDHPVFGVAEHLAGLWKRVATAQAKDNIQKGLSVLRHIIAISQVSLESLSPSKWHTQLKLPSEMSGIRSWLDARISTIREEETPLPTVTSTADRIATATDKGFPEGHALVMTTDAVDKRRRLFSQIKDAGVVVDCSMPKGARKADKTARDATMATVMRETAGGFGKNLAADAVRALTDRLGDNLRAICTSVETLAAFVGDRAVISASDVSAVVPHTRTDPIFELTNAVRAGNVSGALSITAALLTDGMHPLQILATVVNFLRRLRMARGFLDSSFGRCWHNGCPYREFTDRVVPEIKQYDEHVFGELSGDGASNGLGAKTVAEVRLAPKGGSPYPLFLLIGAAAEMTQAGVEDAMMHIADSDVRLKSSAGDARLEIERTIIAVCGSLRARGHR